MTLDPTGNDPCQTPDALAKHCRVLGLPIWRIDDRGVAVARPTGWGGLDPWFRSGSLTEQICDAVKTWGGPLPPAAELFKGCWLLPIAMSDGPYRPSYTVAMALGTQILVSEEADAVSADAGLDLLSAKDELAQLGRFRPFELLMLTDSLRRLYEESSGSEGRIDALGVFSEQLAHAYEQISMLYKLGRSMNWLARPEDFVEMTCNMLLAMFEFSWIAVKYSPSRPIPPQLAGELVVTGTLPCPQQELDERLGTLLHSFQGDHWNTLLEPPRHELATHVGCQVIAERVMAGGRVGALLLAGGKTGDDPDVTSIETQLIDAIADYLGAFLHNVGLYAEQQEMFLGTVLALSAAIDAKDRYTQGHSERVALLGSRLAAACGMTNEQAERVRIAGLVHDIGKIGVPEAVLCKPGRLTADEFEQIKRHPVIGHTILKDIRPLEDVLPGVLYHHERWDGGGYPEGLSGEGIPHLGRLLAVGDAFDAMSSNRSYRSAMERDKVLQEINDCAGTQFDPELARKFVTLDLADYDALVTHHQVAEAEAA